jgi:D-serine deaminase-like pyridoxal phosphate-dependent protein
MLSKDFIMIPTPALIIDLPTAQRNIDKLARYAAKHKIGIRPHTKTHKLIEMSRRQLAAGAVGLTVAKVGELEVMSGVGDDLLLAYPALDPARTHRIAEISKRKMVRVAVDSKAAVDALSSAVVGAESAVGILVDLDVGYHRTGLQTPELALELAQYVDRAPGVRLDGLFTYPGHVTLAADQQNEVLHGINERIAQTLSLWKRHGLHAGIVSGGSTPTAFQSHLIPTVTEIRPGTYVYYDRNCIVGGWCEVEDCAAHIVCTVVSNAVPGKCVIDAGSKTLTSDRLYNDPTGAQGFGYVVEYPQAKIVRLSEEHGEIDLSQCDDVPQLGDRVHVIPNHVCPCVNLQNSIWLRDESGEQVMPVDARGRLS